MDTNSIDFTIDDMNQQIITFVHFADAQVIRVGCGRQRD